MRTYFILVALATALCVQPAVSQQLVPLTTQNGLVTAVKGVWENPRKGIRLSIQDQSMTLYNFTDTLCLKDELSTEELKGFLRYYHVGEDELTLSMRDENSTMYYFDRLDSLPAACTNEVQGIPKETFAYFSDLMVAYYPFFDLYNVDWAARRAEFEPQVHDDMPDEALFDILSNMLKGINDGHISLGGMVDGEHRHFSPTRTRELGPNLDSLYYQQRKIKELGVFHTQWFQGNMKAVNKKVLNKRGQGQAVDGTIVWGRIGKVGYIKILGMEGYSDGDSFSFDGEVAGAHAAISKAIEALSDTESLIVDVAFNRGGMDEVSLAIASHFTDERRLAYTKKPHRSNRAPQPLYVEPADKALYLKPVALLTSEITASAAEIFTMAMRALPQVTHYGEATFGALSDILSKSLPNGWGLGISNERYEDAEGIFWEGRGITPHKIIKLFDPNNIYTSYPDALIDLASELEEEGN